MALVLLVTLAMGSVLFQLDHIFQCFFFSRGERGCISNTDLLWKTLTILMSEM